MGRGPDSVSNFTQLLKSHDVNFGGPKIDPTPSVFRTISYLSIVDLQLENRSLGRNYCTGDCSAVHPFLSFIPNRFWHGGNYSVLHVLMLFYPDDRLDSDFLCPYDNVNLTKSHKQQQLTFSAAESCEVMMRYTYQSIVCKQG